MKIVKNPSGIYVARITTEHGQRVINLKVKSLEAARTVAKESKIAEAELLAKIGGVKKDVIASVVLGQRVRCNVAADEYGKHLQVRVSPRQVINCTLILRSWLRDMKLVERFPHEINERHVDDWVNARESRAKAGTRQLKLSTVRRFLDFCCIRCYAVTNPAMAVRVRMELLKHEQKERKVVQPITTEQYDIIIKAYEAQHRRLIGQVASARLRMDTYVAGGGHPGAFQQRLRELTAKSDRTFFWQCATSLSWHTGLRLGDICQLQWASLQIPGKIVVWTDKTNARIELRLKPGVQALLRSAPKTDETWVFPVEREHYIDPHKNSAISYEFIRFTRHLGMKTSFHALRHAHATQANNKGVPLDLLRQRLGHRSSIMTNHYVH